ncbi:MAG: hypothetical protein QN174_07720 [Armatimonadota bacterium]|nr:hypothetical protein [Armatimonadota bacterium]
MSPRGAEGGMDLEHIVLGLQTDVAVIRTHLDNHVTAVTGDLRELREDVRDLRNKVERLFGVVTARPPGNGRVGDWRSITVMTAGWAFALLMMVIEFLLKR